MGDPIFAPSLSRDISDIYESINSVERGMAASAVVYSSLGNLGASETLDFANPKQTGTLDADCTFSFTGATEALSTIVLTLTQDATGSRTVTTPTVANTPAAINSTASKSTLIKIYYDGADYWWLTLATET